MWPGAAVAQVPKVVAATARAPGAVPADFAGVVSELGSPDVAGAGTGGGGGRRGGGAGRGTSKERGGAVRAGPVTLEQRERLLSIAHQKFDNEPRGAMGIQFNMASPDTRGALIEAPKQGFNAFEVLRVNDRVIFADGLPIDRRETLRKIIVSHDPGDEVPLVVERDGATLEVRVKLGEFSRLNQPMDRSVMDMAWAHRTRGYCERDAAAPIESGLSDATLPDASESDEDADLDQIGRASC